MADIFISYAREDRETAGKLAEALTDRLLDVWWDTELLPQAAFRQEIERELLDARIVIVLWSDASRASRFVNDEAHRAQETETLLQISLDGNAPPMGFGGAFEQIIDLSGWTGDTKAAAFQGLIGAVRTRLPDRSEIADLQAETAILAKAIETATARVRRTTSMAIGAVIASAIAVTLAAYSAFQGTGAEGPQAKREGGGDLAGASASDQPAGNPSLNGYTDAPSAAEVIAASGKWLTEFSVNQNGKMPQEFKHFFIFVKGDSQMAPGAVITGEEWRPYTQALWSIRHGYYANRPNVAAPEDEVTYLGPYWQPWYKDLGDQVFRMKGGKKLDYFEEGPD